MNQKRTHGGANCEKRRNGTIRNELNCTKSSMKHKCEWSKKDKRCIKKEKPAEKLTLLDNNKDIIVNPIMCPLCNHNQFRRYTVMTTRTSGANKLFSTSFYKPYVIGCLKCNKCGYHIFVSNSHVSYPPPKLF